VKRRIARAAPYALLLAVAAVLYAVALRIEYVGPAERIGPDFWPRAILGVLVVVCAYELVKIFLFAHARSTDGLLQGYLDASDEQSASQPPNASRLLLGIGAAVGYVLLVDVLGFFLATAAFLAAFIRIGGYRRYGLIAACALGGSLAMVMIFMKLVYVSLPLGTGPFRLVSVALLAALGVR
jgi:hypothetical protein